mmetsp:Transcript_28084/g.51311  ORF Transcript_28084/g.51311 Transcript_28084/m.51311 type:complete len:415 (-) Transcript_28084:39-1283(-)
MAAIDSEEAAAPAPAAVLPGARPYECKGKSVCPLVRSPESLVDIVVELAQISDSDLFADLGCGDARLLLRAAGDFGARCVGFEVEATCLATSRSKVQEAGMGDRVEIIEHDIMRLDGHPRWEEATVVFAYLLPQVIHQLEPLLRGAVDRGARVILFCTAAGRGNVIGDMQPAAQAVSGLLRMYCNNQVATRLGLATTTSTSSLEDPGCSPKAKLSLPVVGTANSHGLVSRSGSCTSLASRETSAGDSSPSNHSSCSSSSNGSRRGDQGRRGTAENSPGSSSSGGSRLRQRSAAARVQPSPRSCPQLQRPRCSLPSTAEFVDRTLQVEVKMDAPALAATAPLARQARRAGSQRLAATAGRGSEIERQASTVRGASWAAQRRSGREEDKARMSKHGQAVHASRNLSNQVALTLGLR